MGASRSARVASGFAASLAMSALLAFHGIVVGDPPPPTAGSPGPAASPKTPLLVDVARAWGLPDFETGRVQAVDLDGDGAPDLVFAGGKRAFHNVREKGACRFVEITDATGLVPEKGRGADLLAWGDVDGDGDVDCFYGRNGDFAKDLKTGKPRKEDDGLRSEIYLNDGKGKFTRKEASGVGDQPETTSAATFFDYDRDGVLDLYVGNWYVRYGESLECYPSRLFHGKGDGTFVDVTEKAGMLGQAEEGHRDSRRPVYGVTHTDWDGDGDDDLLVCAYGRQWNVLWRNDGDGKFTDVAEATGFDGDAERSGVYPAEARKNPRLKDLEDEKPFRSNGNTFDAAVADFDADGDMDVFLAEITHWWAGPSSDRSTLLVNQGAAGKFAFSREERGIVREHASERWNQGDLFAGWMDLDHDGALDLFVVSGDYPDDQRLRFFRPAGDGTFRDATKGLVDWTSGSQPTVADFDGNGAEDLLLGNSNHRLEPAQTKDRVLRAALFAHTPTGGWLRLTLVGRGAGSSNVSALGAKVTLRAGPLTAVRQVFGSRGHAGHADELPLTFGVGDHAVVDSIEIRWPDRKGTVQRFEKVQAGRAYRCVEGSPLEVHPR